MFTRFNGNVVPFADDATSTNRTVFGGITQSDLIDDNLNTNFKKGWEIVGLNDNPTREDFNGMGYTLGALISYLYEMGISEWNTSQNYRVNSRVTGSDGKIYKSLTGTTGIPNVGNNPTTDAVNWEVDTQFDINSLVAKIIPNDSDYLAIQESGGLFKKTSWANIKAGLNSLYVGLAENQTIAGVKTFSTSPIVPTPTTGTQAVNKDYADTKVSKPELVTKTGSATFNGTTQNINLTNIGNITLAIGDVIEVSGTTSNNKLFTVENITDNNNIVVNYEHRGTSTPASKGRLINETASNCTIKLYNRAKNAPIGQGQYWCSPTRPTEVAYTNNTNRTILISIYTGVIGTSSAYLYIDGVPYILYSSSNSVLNQDISSFTIPPKSTYQIAQSGSVDAHITAELR